MENFSIEKGQLTIATKSFEFILSAYTKLKNSKTTLLNLDFDTSKCSEKLSTK